jgi:ketosteroid isomerase-like protein
MATSIKQLVEEINLAFEKGDLKFLEEHMTDDLTWNIIGRDHPVIGKQEFLKVCGSAPLQENTPKITITNMLIDGDKVAVESILEAKTIRGKHYRQTVCDIYHFNGNKFNELTTYLNTAYDKELLDGKTIHPYYKNHFF